MSEALTIIDAAENQLMGQASFQCNPTLPPKADHQTITIENRLNL